MLNMTQEGEETRTTDQWSIETPSFIKTATFEEAQEFFDIMQELV